VTPLIYRARAKKAGLITLVSFVIPVALTTAITNIPEWVALFVVTPLSFVTLVAAIYGMSVYGKSKGYPSILGPILFLGLVAGLAILALMKDKTKDDEESSGRKLLRYTLITAIVLIVIAAFLVRLVMSQAGS
jgi:hypothetical protein